MTVKQDSAQKELPLDTILFASPSEGGKDSGALGKDALKKVEACENSTWKITCKDGDGRRSSFKAEPVSYGKNGNSVTVRYSNAPVGETEYVSAVIKNSSGEVTYYGRLAKIDSADTSNGEIEIDLTDRIENGDKLYIFSEQCNGENATDYAGELQEIPLLTKPAFSVKSHHITAGEDEMLEVSLPEDATGTVSLTVSDQKGNQATYALRSSEQEGDWDGELVRGKGTVRMEKPGAGRHTVIAVYSGDGNYYEKDAETAFVVRGTEPSVSAGSEVLRNPIFAGNAPVVYFGKDSEGTACAWYAVGYDGEGAVPQEGCVTLFAYGNIAHSYFNESQQDNNRYAESSLKNTIEGLAGRFNTTEKAAIVKRTLQSGNYNGRNTDCVKGPIVEDAVL